MRYIYLYEFRGIEATFTIGADNRTEADERFQAMKSALFEGTLEYEIPISDEETNRLSGKVMH